MKRLTRLSLGLTVLVATIATVLLASVAAVGASQGPTAKSAPAAQDQYNRRITVCHRSGRKLKRSKYRTIRIPPRALRGHLRHGDGRGACSSARFTICHKTKANKRRTATVRGWKAHRKHMRHGDKIRACPKKKKKKK